MVAEKSNPNSASNRGIRLTAAANRTMSGERRRARITVTAGSGASRSFTVEQEPYSAINLIRNGSVMSTTGINFTLPYTGGSQAFTLQWGTGLVAASDFTIEVSAPCSITNSYNTGQSRTVTFGENMTSTVRQCTIWARHNNQNTNTYSFTQAAYYDEEGNVAPEPEPGDEPGADGEVEGSQSECRAGKMGWVLCPLIEGLDNALGGIYGWIETNFLQIDLAFYRTTNTDGTPNTTYEAWQTFRNIANIIFVIIFMVIILSQITSVGINNYGIKKMLPELIMAAVLINLSFFICQAMVDFSNILGVQIRLFLDAITPSAGYASVAPEDGTAGFFAIIIGVAVGALAVSVITTVLAGGWFAVILGVLMALIVAAVGILMVFVILIIRQIGVIALIVLAPLAFAARILPNTQGLFKKWWSAFVALLVVYPVCSLVIGMGALAGAIIGGNVNAAEINSGGINIAQGIWIIATVLAAIVPYFAVIALSKGALKGLGAFGGMISGKVQGTGAGINKMGAKGAGMAQKKYDQSARRIAQVDKAKNKAEQKAAIKGAKPGSAVDKMYQSKLQTAQTVENAAAASRGVYEDDGSGSWRNKQLMKASAENAAEIGIDPITGLPTREARDDTEKRKQMEALDLRNKADTKLGEEIAESFGGLSAEQIYDKVYDGGSGKLKSGVSAIEAEQAIAAMQRKGEWGRAEALDKAHHSQFGGDKRALGRKGRILQSSDAKEQDWTKHAYGKALAEGKTTLGYEEWVKEGNLQKNIGKYKKIGTLGSMHGEAIDNLAKLDSDGKIREEVGKEMTLQSFSQMGGHDAEKFMAGMDDAQVESTFGHLAKAYVDAGDNAATLGISEEMQKRIGVDRERQRRANQGGNPSNTDNTDNTDGGGI